MCSRLYYLGLCKYTLWSSTTTKSPNDISQNVSPSLSDTYLYDKVQIGLLIETSSILML